MKKVGEEFDKATVVTTINAAANNLELARKKAKEIKEIEDDSKNILSEFFNPKYSVFHDKKAKNATIDTGEWQVINEKRESLKQKADALASLEQMIDKKDLARYTVTQVVLPDDALVNMVRGGVLTEEQANSLLESKVSYALKVKRLA